MAQYTSSYTGSQIDSAVSKTLATETFSNGIVVNTIEIGRYKGTVHSGNIDREAAPLYIQAYNSNPCIIGDASADSNKLKVAGSVGATAYNNTSDIRLKEVVKDVNIPLEKIAEAPSFIYTWKDKKDSDNHVGTSANYWKDIIPEAISEDKSEEKILSMQYGVVSLVSVISIAKEMVELKKKVALLEERIDALAKEVSTQE